MNGVQLFVNILLIQIVTTSSQTNNVKTIVSSFLRECYSDSNLLNRNNLPPMTLPVLLDLIRKVEDSEIGDMRQFSTAVVHLFRQDGIVYDPTASGTQNIVPFSPTGFQAYKNRLLLNKLLNNNILNFQNDMFLVAEDKCALHHMVSSSTALQNRGDEEWTCNRITRDGNSNVRLNEYRKSQDIEMFDVNAPMDKLARQITGITPCPIETGVVATPWGEVSMGTVVAGISAGLEEQRILVSDLVTVQPGFNNDTLIVNNRHASTLSGDIAEAAIRQGVSHPPISVGAPGGWNSTTARRYYFLNQNQNLELTDAEIRGGLDGLVLSELANEYVKRFPEFKLSQLIDMYYSHNGILHEARFRACNRKVLVPDIAPAQTLMTESLGTAVALYHTSSLSGSTNLQGIERFVNEAVQAFHRYIPQNIEDAPCLLATEQVIRPKINLILITEPTFARSALISHIVDKIDVGKFGSSIMLLNAETGDVVVDRTFSIALFYEAFAKRMLAQSGPLDMLNALQSLVTIVSTDLNNESHHGYSGGNATVALFLSDTIPLAGNERVQTIHRALWLKQKAPDLRMLFVASPASETAVTPILNDFSEFFGISLTSLSPSFDELKPVITSIIQSPRRIINPACGSQWVNVNSGVVGFDGFVDADGINLYRIVPNYFFGSSTSRLLRILSTEHGAISVCHSRTNIFPRRNRTSTVVPNDVACESVSGEGIMEISLVGACDGYYSISSCPPLYLSVASMLIPADPQCTDGGCRFPNDIKYLVSAHDLGCYDAAHFNFASKILVVICAILVAAFDFTQNTIKLH